MDGIDVGRPVLQGGTMDAGAQDSARGLIAAFLAGFPPLGAYRFEFVAEEAIRPPAYAGSAWRGLLGDGLRRTVCVTRQPRCEGCLLLGTCAYSTIFESPPRDPADRARYTAVPHPYVLVAAAHEPQEVPAGAPLGFGLVLLGAANSALPYLVHALGLAGERGLGRRQARFRFQRLWQAANTAGDWETIYTGEGSLRALPGLAANAFSEETPPAAVRVELLTPLRIKRQGHLLGPADLDLREWLRQLLWRLNDLARYYGSGAHLAWAEIEPALAGLHAEARRLTWHDWTRYSSRQDALMQMGGLVGEIHLSGPGLATLWPLLRLGEWLHLGKATSMGLGRYRLSDPASLPAQPAAGGW